MATLQEKMTVEDVAPGGQAPEVYRYYELAKKQEWQVRDMPWRDLPPIPETTGSKERVEKRRGIWRSVVTQQLQADEFMAGLGSTKLPIVWVGDFNSDAEASVITGVPSATATYGSIIAASFSDA